MHTIFKKMNVCGICNVEATSVKNFQAHLNGKFHQKKLLRHNQANQNESNPEIEKVIGK